MDHVRDSGPILFLWRSACAVVMGKNQNPWKECRLDMMIKEDVPLARRISGGGTVYHDEGNLNYCVITEREAYQEEKAYQLVFRTLESFGIQAEKTGKSNLSVGGLKFSGNAFAFRKGRAMHHGTLLLETDLDRLGRYLGSMLEGIETHAIASEPADVMNLGVARGELITALKTVFQQEYGDETDVPVHKIDPEVDVFSEIKGRQVSDDWKFGATPAFSFIRQGEGLNVRKGIIQNGEFSGMPFSDVVFSLFC